MFNFFKKDKDYDFQFLDIMDIATYHLAPPVLAKNLNPLKENQINKHDHYHFAHCPGMYNYAKMGYIIPAWANIWIKSNKADSLVFVNMDRIDNPLLPRKDHSPKLAASRMNNKISDGFCNFNEVSPNTFRLSTPWKLYSKKRLSFLLMPAYFHNPIFNNQIRGFPGIIDVSNSIDGFSAVTFIFSIVEKFEHIIKIGDPLLHVIPIQTPETCNGSYGYVEEKERMSAYFGSKFCFEKNFYRKFFQKKKKYTLSKRKEVQNLDSKFIDE